MVFTDNSYSNRKIKSHHGQVIWVFFTLNGSFRLRDAVFLAKVGRLVAMPSTSRTLPISEKFCKAKGIFFWHRTQNKIKILSEIPWRRLLLGLSLLMARKRL